MNVLSISNPGFDYLTQNPGIITNGLLCHYDFSNPNCYNGLGTTCTDLTTSGETGTLVAGTPWRYNPNTGSVFFNGSSNMTCTNVTLRNLSAITIAYWFNYTGGNGTQGVVCAGGSSGARNFQSTIKNGSGAQYGMEWYSVATGEFFSSNIATAQVTGWHYWTVTCGGGGINWYNDGTLINQTTSVPALGSTGGTQMVIGQDFFGTYVNGYLNVFKIYNRVLTATEVAYNYTAGRWRFL